MEEDRIRREALMEEEHQRSLQNRLLEKMERWERAERLHRFINAVAVGGRAYTEEERRQTDAWAEWARAQVDSIDPVMQSDTTSLERRAQRLCLDTKSTNVLIAWRWFSTTSIWRLVGLVMAGAHVLVPNACSTSSIFQLTIWHLSVAYPRRGCPPRCVTSRWPQPAQRCQFAPCRQILVPRDHAGDVEAGGCARALQAKAHRCA